MDEVDLSQRVKETLNNLAQEIGQSYQLPSYLKPLLTEGQATVVFRLYKNRIILETPFYSPPPLDTIPVMPVVAVTEEPPKIEVVELETPKAETEATEEPAKQKRKRKNEV